jgi:hypothetical protein
MAKRVLNTHISTAEHAFLVEQARAEDITVTMFLRNLIQRQMRRRNKFPRRVERDGGDLGFNDLEEGKRNGSDD